MCVLCEAYMTRLALISPTYHVHYRYHVAERQRQKPLGEVKCNDMLSFSKSLKYLVCIVKGCTVCAKIMSLLKYCFVW